jgi:glycine hydroxymethyltransferase
LIERGHDLVSGGTDNHLLLVDLTAQDVGGRAAAQALEQAGLVCNYNAVPFDPRPRWTHRGSVSARPPSPPAA